MLKTYTLSQLVSLFGGRLLGDDKIINGVSPIHLATNTDITFLGADVSYNKYLDKCHAAAIIISNEHANDTILPKIIADSPVHYFSLVSNLFYPRHKNIVNIASSSIIASSAKIGSNASIAQHVAIGNNVVIGSNCQIYANVVIGDDTVIGDNATIYSNVSIYHNVHIGNEVVLHSGCVIGSDGFGNTQDADNKYYRMPQIGGVKIGNAVEIGANSTIDCGTFEATEIADGVKIDNLVQIAHNVTIGAHTAIAALVGIAGHAIIGQYCKIGGHVGIAGHLSICDHVMIGGGSLVSKSITEPGLYSSALYAMKFRTWAKTLINIKNLAAIGDSIKALSKKDNAGGS